MGYYKFEKETKISSERELKEKFSENELRIRGESASVTFNGCIKLIGKIIFEGNCSLADGVCIDEGCIISESSIGKRSTIRPYSLIYKSILGKDNIIGPFCFIRDKSNVSNSCVIGNTVELVRSQISNHVKISHQSYIGDADIGESTIIGAGSVFCNYDGIKHQKTKIGSNSLVGSGSMIISPVIVGENVTIAAGSIVNKDIKNNVKYIQKR